MSAANPANGDGTVANLAVVADENTYAHAPGCPPAGCPAVDVTVTGDVAGVLVHLEVLVVKSDNSLPNIEHKWGANLSAPDGWTICDAGGSFPPCDPAKVSADVTQKQLTFTGLVLAAALGDADAATLTGTISW